MKSPKALKALEDKQTKKILKELMKQQKPLIEPIKINDVSRPPRVANNKVTLTNKLQVSPLNQELKPLGPLSPSKQPHFKQPVFTKYSHREVVLPPRKKSPSTIEDPGKPSFINKAKAKKLRLLQKTINSCEHD